MPSMMTLARSMQQTLSETAERLPDAVREVWHGPGGTHGPAAAVKLQVRLDLCRGTLRARAGI